MNTNSNKGKLIIFEGIDGTGKSTQLQLVDKALTARGYETVVTREPTNGYYGQKIRQLYLNRSNTSREEELELFLNDRKEHVQQLITPALKKGCIVLCDRYYLSTAAYQGAVGFDPLEIIKKNSFAPKPDLALLFHIPVELSIQRITESRGDVLNEFEQKDSLKKVSQIFASLYLPFIHRIDASSDINQVHHEVMQSIETIL